MVRCLCEWLLDDGQRPAIAMRGYGANRHGGSDEATEYRDLLPDVPVVVDRDRVAALQRFLPEHPDIDCVVLDDGFQHRRLARTLDLVLIDASRETMRDRLLPAGHLREPVAALRRADAVVMTRATTVDGALATTVEHAHGRPPLAWSHHAWTGLDVYRGARPRPEPTTWLAGRRVATAFGLGHPEAVERAVVAAGATIATSVALADHEAFTPGVLARTRAAAERAGVLVVTHKDWVRLRRVLDWSDWPSPVVVPRLAIEFIAGADALRDLVRRAAAGHRELDA